MPADKCDERLKACDTRFKSTEEEVCQITKPEVGALAIMKSELLKKISSASETLHEKVNGIADSRVKWSVFWSIISVLIIVMVGSFSYTKSIADDQKGLATKDDIKRVEENMEKTKNELIGEIRRMRP